MPGTITPIGVGTAPSYTKAISAGVGYNMLVDPGNTNVPIIFEPPSGLTDGMNQIWIVATGGAYETAVTSAATAPPSPASPSNVLHFAGPLPAISGGASVVDLTTDLAITPSTTVSSHTTTTVTLSEDVATEVFAGDTILFGGTITEVTSAPTLPPVPAPPSNVLTFTGPLPGTISLGATVVDITTPNAIPPNATVIAITATTITLNEDVTGAGVLLGDTIGFYNSQWGGCQVWISSDDNTYALAGTIWRGARQGLLTATLPSAADPDDTNTLEIDLSMSQTAILSGTATELNMFATLCYCDGELLSYQYATLTAPYKYNLNTLRRGVYGSTIGAHASGAQFARIGPNDPAVLEYVYPTSYVGQTIYIKLPAFNSYGQRLQSLDSVAAMTYTLAGTGAVLPGFTVAGSQSGTTLANAVIEQFAFCSTVIFPGEFAESQAISAVAATATTQYSIQKTSGGVTTVVGTMTFAASARIATFASTTAHSIAFNAGDELTIVAPASPDATLAGLAWSLSGHQGLPLQVVEAHGSQSGPTTANLVMERWVAVNPITFPAALFGSVGLAGVAATGSTTYTIEQNGTPIGTMVFAAGGTAATFTAASATVFNPGDVLTIVAPATPDATLANLSWALPASNSLVNPEGYVTGGTTGALTANLVVQRYVFADTLVVPAGMAGSYGVAATPGVGSTAFLVEKNGTTVGTTTFAGSAATATFAMASPTTFNPGDVLTVVAPASPDATLNGIAWSFAGNL